MRCMGETTQQHPIMPPINATMSRIADLYSSQNNRSIKGENLKQGQGGRAWGAHQQ